jgi:hypothetical protein
MGRVLAWLLKNLPGVAAGAVGGGLISLSLFVSFQPQIANKVNSPHTNQNPNGSGIAEHNTDKSQTVTAGPGAIGIVGSNNHITKIGSINNNNSSTQGDFSNDNSVNLDLSLSASIVEGGLTFSELQSFFSAPPINLPPAGSITVESLDKSIFQQVLPNSLAVTILPTSPRGTDTLVVQATPPASSFIASVPDTSASPMSNATSPETSESSVIEQAIETVKQWATPKPDTCPS